MLANTVLSKNSLQTESLFATTKLPTLFHWQSKCLLPDCPIDCATVFVYVFVKK